MTSLLQSRVGVLSEKHPSHPSTIPEAEWLLTCVAADGAIREEPGDPNVRPYMSNYGAMGLARAYEVTSNPAYLTACWGWLAWYRDHMDPTTGYVNDYASTFTDTFDRADGVVGNGWTAFPNAGQSAPVIASNRLASAGSNSWELRRTLPEAPSRIDVTLGEAPPGGGNFHLFCGSVVGGSILDWTGISVSQGSGGDWRLWTWVAGTPTQQALASATRGAGVVTLEHDGGTYTGYLDGVAQVSWVGSASWGAETAVFMADVAGTLDTFVAHMTNFQDSGAADSTDAYAGTYLVALYLTYWADPDGDTNLVPFAASIPLAMTAIESTQQSDGLTFALPTYDVKYLEDNIETLAGARAAQSMGALTAVSSTQPGLHARAQATADALAIGIGYMWNHDAGTWDYAIHASRVYAHNDWSDENSQRQQIWATAWSAVASEGEGRAIMAAYVAALPGWATQFSPGYEPMPVWGYRHVNQTTEANAGAASVEATGVSQGRAYPWTCAISGTVLVGLLGFSTAMPSPLVIFPAGVNLIPDPQFLVDSNSDGRIDAITGTYGDPSFALHPLTGGGSYQEVDTPDGNGWAFNWDPIAVEENTYVTFSLWRRVTRMGVGGQVNLLYKLYDVDNALVTYGYVPQTVVDGTDFERWYVNAWIPPGVVTLVPTIELASGTIDIAYPQVEKSGSPTAPPYGVPVPSATTFTDDFTRADGAIGNGWDAVYASMVVLADTARAGAQYATVTRDIGTTDCDLTGVFRQGTGETVYLVGREADVDHAVKVAVNASTLSIISASSIVATVGISRSTIFTLRFVLAGTSYTAYVDGVQVATGTFPGGSPMGTRAGFQVDDPSQNDYCDTVTLSY